MNEPKGSLNPATPSPAMRYGTVLLVLGAMLAWALVLALAARSNSERAGALLFGAVAIFGSLVWIYRSLAGQSEALAAARAAETRLRSVIESTDASVITTDIDGRVLTWNAGAERLFLFSRAEAVGRSIFELSPAHQAATDRTVYGRVTLGQSVGAYDAVRLRKEGATVEVRTLVAALRRPDGTVSGAVVVDRDMTELRRTEREMGLALTELRDVKAALDEHSIVAITDGSGRITYVNDKFCAISGYAREELLGRDHRIINSGYHPKAFFTEMWRTIGRGSVWRGEIRNRAKAGHHYWVETTIFPRLDPAGAPIQYIAIRTDITQRKAAEIEMLEAARELSDKNKELETILYTVSHDLRSPLVNVQGFGRQLTRACERLRTSLAAAPGGVIRADEIRDALETSMLQSLRFINAGTTKMDLLLTGLLRYSRLGRVSLTIVPLEMNALVAEIVAAMRFQLNEAKAEIEVGALPGCLGDSVYTSQVFANLLDNAIKYRDPDRTLRIELAGRTEAGHAIFSIRDNGMGIASDHQAKIFDIFHRLNPDATPGEGLGLTIAQRLLDRQKGKIWVESSEGSGSTFFVSLPLPDSLREDTVR